MILLLMMIPVFSQGSQQIVSARVMSGGYAIKGVLVVNVRAEREARTDSLGVFRIRAIMGDTLVVTDPGIKPVRVIINDKFSNSMPIVNVELNDVYQLEEVVVEKYNALNSEALGLVPKGQKKYTSQERKLYTAGDFKLIHLLGLLGGSFPLDPVFNAINGRTKTLKKTIAIEKKESTVGWLNRMFSDDEIVTNYNIPQDYVQGFYYYCVEDSELAAAVKAGNDTKARFLMSSLALAYLDMISETPKDKDEE